MRAITTGCGQGNQVHTQIFEFGLAREFMIPLSVPRVDPFVALVGALSGVEANEVVLYQVIFDRVRHPWAESIVSAATNDDGDNFFVNVPELAKAAHAKAAQPLFAATVRLAAAAADPRRVCELMMQPTSAFGTYSRPGTNELVLLDNEDYPFDDHLSDLLRRQCRRTGMLLSADELLGLVHLPAPVVRSPALVRLTARTKPAPSLGRSNSICLGENWHGGRKTPVYLPSDLRVRHLHLIGTSGTGKSTLLLHLLRQDIESGAGLALLDPHGDLIDQVLASIPPSRFDDVILFDPADSEFPIGFNILAAHSDLEKTLLASDLVSTFARLSTSWGDQMASVLQNAILAFLESSEGGTLADLRRFLIEPAWREQFLRTVGDPELVYYWRKGFTQLTGNKSIGPVLTRLETLLAPKSIRYMVAQRENRLDFADIMDTGKIFLARLPQGQIGHENAFLLGSLLVTKFQQTAMSRQAKDADVRRDFWLYLDEFQHFITPSMGEILRGARKYRLGLILAHQELRQLERDREVASAVLSNAGTRVCFRVGDDDARKLADGFSFFEARDLQNLEPGNAIGRIERSDADFNLWVPLPEPPAAATAAEARKQIQTSSRAKYGTPRAEVEAALFRQLGLDQPEPAPTSKTTASPQKARPTGTPPTPAPKAPEAPPQPTPTALPKPAPDGATVAEGSPTTGERREHEAIKGLIRRQAEALDFTVSVEEAVPGSQGRADMVLRRGRRVIACEISVTTNAAQEVGNLTKCLSGGFAQVAMICRQRSRLSRISDEVSAMVSPEEAARIGYFHPDEFLAKLFDWATEDPQGGADERSKPRKRMISLDAAQITDADRRQQEAEMLKRLAEAMKRVKPEA